MQGQDIGFGVDNRAQVQAFIGPVEPDMLLIFARFIVQPPEHPHRFGSIDRPFDLHARTVEDLLHNRFRQTGVLALEQADPFMIRVLECLITGVE